MVHFYGDLLRIQNEMLSFTKHYAYISHSCAKFSIKESMKKF